MDPDARDLSPEPVPQPQPYDDLEDDLGDDDGGAGWNRDRSPTPVHGDDGAGSSARPRKRLLKKGGKGDSGGVPAADELEDWGGDVLADEGVDPDAARKRKGSSSLRDLAKGGSGGGGKERHEKKRRKEDRGGMVREKRGSGSSSGGKGGGARGGGQDDDEGEREIRELWDTIAGEGGSEVTTMAGVQFSR
jgi:transcription factor SPN1